MKMKFLFMYVMSIRNMNGADIGHTMHRIQVMKNLVKIGNEVHVLASDDEIAKKIRSEGIIVHEVNTDTHFSHLSMGIKTPLISLILHSIIKLLRLVIYTKTFLYLQNKYPVDILYTRNSEPLFGLIGMLIRFNHKTKLIYEVSGIISDEWKTFKCRNPVKNLWKRLLFFIDNFVAKRADGIRAVTEGIKNELIRQGVDGEKIIVIGNGADTDLFKPMEKEKVKEELNLDKSTHYICFVGNLAPWQGVEYLIRAAPLILQEIPNTKFLIIGDGMMKEKLIEMSKELNLENKFIFTGFVYYEKVPKYINASDVCVALKSHLKSGYSTLKMYEYLSCGRPIVASNEPGLGDVLKKNNAGIAVNRENTQEVANAIITLIKNNELRENMGKNGRKLVVENYSWNAITRKIAEACEQLINK